MDITENIKLIKEKIAESAVKSGKNPENIFLVAVTKTVPVSRIQIAIDAGITDIGENRVQETKMKFSDLQRKVNWHLIGHLQTNKVKQSVEMFDMIQSLDRMELAQEIQKRAVQINKIQDVLIQVNTSGEETKSGCHPDETVGLLKSISNLDNLKIKGLMTIGPLTQDKEKIRDSFKILKGLFQEISSMNINRVEMKFLSMGMSQDFQMAIEEGSNMVRVGTAIFGERH